VAAVIGLIWALGLGLIGATAAVVTFALLGRKDAATIRQLGDLLNAERDQHRVTHGELDLETAAHAVTRALLAKEKDLRASAESERNQCVREDRENTIKLIESSGVADALHLGNRILSQPLPGARLSESGSSALEKP
jgi:hypothetical protein